MNLGIVIIILTLLMFGVYFPDKGSMLCGPGGWGKYDPQLIKPPDDYRGADSIDFAAHKENTSTSKEVSAA